jgi:hypothetical protein
MRRLLVAPLVAILTLSAPSAYAQAQPVPPYGLDDCQAQDAGPAQRRLGNPLAELAARRTRVDCQGYSPAVAISCTLSPPRPEAENQNVLATCQQVSDLYGGIEYICAIHPLEDGVRQWACGTVARPPRGQQWTWDQPVSP